MAAKLSVSVRMDLVIDMYTDAKRAMRSNTFVIPFYFLYFYWILLLCPNPEMRRFSYSGISREECEGTLCHFLLDESIAAASSLI